jgi:hypothetical protein
MASLTHPYLQCAARLFEQAEAEAEPSRKFAALYEALELIELVLHDLHLPAVDHVFAKSLSRANIHKLMSQLVVMHGMDSEAWFKYIELLFIRSETEVISVLAEDASLMTGYEALMDAWRGRLLKSGGQARARRI